MLPLDDDDEKDDDDNGIESMIIRETGIQQQQQQRQRQRHQQQVTVPDTCLLPACLPQPKMSAKHNQEQDNNDNEHELLASVAASLHEQDAYEEAVIRHATHQWAPTLTGMGVPPLLALLDAGAATATASFHSLPHHHWTHVYTILARTRRSSSQLLEQQQQQQQQQQTSTTTTTAAATTTTTTTLDRLFLKEQLLLSLLLQVAHLSGQEKDLPVCLPEERAREAQRSSLLQQQHHYRSQPPVQMETKMQDAHDEMKKKKNTPVAAAVAWAPSIQYRRRSIMKRKQDEMKKEGRTSYNNNNNNNNNNHDKNEKDDDDDENDDDDRAEETKERKEQLQQLRLERKRRRLERQNLWRQWEIVEESEWKDDHARPEAVHPKEQAPTNDKTTLPIHVDDGNEVVTQPAPSDTASCSLQTSTVSCPLCQQDITVKDPTELDAVLSQHIDQCQRQRGSRRPSRRATRRSYMELNQVPASQTPPGSMTEATATAAAARTPIHEHKQETSFKARDKKKKLVTAAAATSADDVQESVLSSSKSIDDLHESSYEDRVDDWIENGLSRMKEMKERDEGDLAPGEEEYPGRLWVPAWVNDRLFGYQRVALQWMWGLHQQEAGGLIGDEMGLGRS